MISLKGKTALVTGASRGIGRSIAKTLAQAGADVAVHYNTNESEAKRLADEIQSLGQRGLILQADVSVKAEVDRMVSEVTKQFGRLDILVNNVGIWEQNRIDQFSEKDYRRTMQTNLDSAVFASAAASKIMKQQKSGTIIHISSTAGQRGEAEHAPYAISKAGLHGLTKSLAAELAQDNIRVNCVAPGWVDTDMSHEALTAPDADRHLRLILLGRPAHPDEIAGPVLFLASDLSTFITGEILNVNGGAVLCG